MGRKEPRDMDQSLVPPRKETSAASSLLGGVVPCLARLFYAEKSSEHTTDTNASSQHCLARPDIPEVDLTDFTGNVQAFERVHGFFHNSTIGGVSRDLPTFDRKEFELGEFLGQGGFSDVDEIEEVDLDSGRHSASTSAAFTNDESRAFIEEHCLRPGGDARYALKSLRQDVLKNPDRCWVGIADLAVEARFLSNLEHPNIIKLRGVASCEPCSTGYFLVLDRLNDTLEAKLSDWSRAYKQTTPSHFVSNDTEMQRNELLVERMTAAFDLSAALEYLHAHNIMHRDCKPDNIGFDCRGDIKIFDFGMARELHDYDKGENDTYLLSMAGSMRYMAPEVALGKRYNASADVYSFSILLWQILAMDNPFTAFRREIDFRTRVFKKGDRPRISPNFSQACQDVLKGGWAHDLHERLTMFEINGMLRRDLVSLRHGEDTGLEHTQRRSTHVFRKKKRPSQSSIGRGSSRLSNRSSLRATMSSTMDLKDIVEAIALEEEGFDEDDE